MVGYYWWLFGFLFASDPMTNYLRCPPYINVNIFRMFLSTELFAHPLIIIFIGKKKGLRFGGEGTVRTENWHHHWANVSDLSLKNKKKSSLDKRVWSHTLKKSSLGKCVWSLTFKTSSFPSMKHLHEIKFIHIWSAGRLGGDFLVVAAGQFQFCWFVEMCHHCSDRLLSQ